MNDIFSPADILLPNFIKDAEKAEKWAVVACDQFTSEPEYWQHASELVADSPSTLNMILPEAFLSADTDNRLLCISDSMKHYKKNVLQKHENTLIYVRRVQSNGKTRCGIVGKIDLEAYDYSVGSVSDIRATEGTVLERIPPRVAVRRAASLEMPHVMLLIDDIEKKVIEPLASETADMTKLYDFDLMLGGGHITGYELSGKQINNVLTDLSNLFACKSGIKFAVGDGNHSLASAKARYEELKAEVGEEKAKLHPLRFALCEVVNLHDNALEFEPIYRLVKTKNIAALLSSLERYGSFCEGGGQFVKSLYGENEKTVSLGKGTHSLTVGTLQKFLDDYKSQNEDVEVDYIHGLDSIYKLSKADNCVGFVFDGMEKEELFRAVESDGALPRKTFSMGEATDKRYYIECREISE